MAESSTVLGAKSNLYLDTHSGSYSLMISSLEPTLRSNFECINNGVAEFSTAIGKSPRSAGSTIKRTVSFCFLAFIYDPSALQFHRSLSNYHNLSVCYLLSHSVTRYSLYLLLLQRKYTPKLRKPKNSPLQYIFEFY